MKKQSAKKMNLFVVIILVTVIAAATLSLVGCGKKATGIEVTVEPTKTAYTVGDTFDPSGMVVSLVYENGTTKEVEDYTYDLTGPLKATDKKVTIFYEDFVVEFSIKVYNPATGLEIKTPATKTEYTVGEVFDPTGMVLSLTYKDNTKKDVPVDGSTKLEYSKEALKADVTEIEIKYSGFTVKQAITVSPAVTPIGELTAAAEKGEESVSTDKSTSAVFYCTSEGFSTNGNVYQKLAVGQLDSAGKYVQYNFTLETESSVDFIWRVCPINGNSIPDLSQVITMTIDGYEVDVSGVALSLASGDSANWTWYNVYLKDVTLTGGSHILRIELKCSGVNGGIMTIGANTAVGGAEVSES